MTQDKIKEYGFLAAGAVNIGGVLLFSLGLSNSVINQADPVVMSNFGLLSIILWGAAYIAVSRSYAAVPGLVVVFAVEKLLYVVAWCYWLWQSGHTLPAIWQQSWLAGTFMAIYGPNDFLFMIFFFWVFWTSKR